MTFENLHSYLNLPDLLHITNKWSATVRNVRELTPKDIEGIRSSFPLQVAPWATELVDVVVGTMRARKAGKAPVNWLFTSMAMEQSTHPRIAQYHANVMLQSLTNRTADTSEQQRNVLLEIGTGAGLDTRAFAQAGFAVVTYEEHAFTAALAMANFKHAGLDSIQVVHKAWSEQSAMPTGTVAIWADPSRRSGHRRIRNSTEYLPSLESLLHIASQPQIQMAGIKVGPADQLTIKQQTPVNKLFIGFQGECKELVLLAGNTVHNATTSVAIITEDANAECTLVSKPASVQSDDLVSMLTNDIVSCFLIEPHPAVIAANMVDQVFSETNATAIDKHIAYGISRVQPKTSLLYQCFHVKQVLTGVRRKELKAALASLGWSNATEFKKRGWPGDPEQLRTELYLPPATSTTPYGTVVITRVGNNHRTLLCQRC